MAGKIKNITTKCTLAQSGVTNDTYPIIGTPGVALSAFTQTFTAKTNFVFNVPPSIDFSNVSDPSDYSVTVTDTKNSKGIVTARVFSIVYTPDVLQPSSDEIVFVANAEPGYNPSTGNIYSYELDTSYLKSTGDNRSIKMYGDPGAVITVQIYNTTPGYDQIDMYTRTYTFQEDGTSLSYVHLGVTYVVPTIDFNIPGLKYWRVPIGDEVIRITFSVSGANTILWDADPVTNGSAELVYLYQYKDTRVILQLSQGDTTGINSGNGFFGVGEFGLDYMINLKDQWNRNDSYTANWTTSLNYAATGQGTNGPFAANPTGTYVELAATSPSGAGVIAETTFSSGNLTQNLVVGRTYKLTFEVRIPTTVGVNGVLFRHSTTNPLYSGANGSRPIGLLGEAYTGSDGWRVVNMEFTAGTTNADKLQILTTNPSNAQGIQISKIRLTPVYAVGSLTTDENSCGNIAILQSNIAGASSDTQEFDFTLRVYVAPQTVPRKGVNYIASALTPVASSIPSSLLNSGNVNTSLVQGTELNITNTIKSSDYNAYRKNYKYTNGSQNEIDVMGVLSGGYNTMNYENGCIATISNTQLKVRNAKFTGSSFLGNTMLEFTGTLNIVKNPVGGNSVIEFNIAGWFTEGSNLTL